MDCHTRIYYVLQMIYIYYSILMNELKRKPKIIRNRINHKWHEAFIFLNYTNTYIYINLPI